MSKRPVLFTLLYWGIVGLVQFYLAVSCGFGAGWDQESHDAIMDCRYEAGVWMQVLNFAGIVVYAILAVMAVRALRRDSGD